MRQAAEIENNFTATQRIIEYIKIESEDELNKPSDENKKKGMDTMWPSDGRIVFENVTMRYRDFLDPSIRGLSFKI